MSQSSRAGCHRGPRSVRLAAWMIFVLSLGMALPPTTVLAQSEAREIRIGRQIGLSYLTLHVMQKQKLVEKHAAAAGVAGLEAKYIAIGSPAALNEQFLSNNIDMAVAGPPPFINLWDRTRENIDVRAVTGLGMLPVLLNTVNAGVRSLKDFTDADRIAVPGVKTSMHAIILGLALEKEYGLGQHQRLDNLLVVLAHPEATTALLSGRSEITAHMSTVPYQNQQLQDPRVHTVLNSYDVTGGPATGALVWAANRFRTANPRVYKAFLDGAEEATAFIKANRAGAARIFIEVENSRMSPPQVEAILADPAIIFDTTPTKLMLFAGYMHRVGLIKNKPATWKDLVFPEIHGRNGS